MSLSMHDVERLRQAGFTEHEINELSNAKTTKGEDQLPINLDGAAWQEVMHSRKEWLIDKIDRGWSEDEILGEIDRYYARDTKRTPFDFLKATYKPTKRIDYIEMIRRKKQQEIAGELEGYKF